MTLKVNILCIEKLKVIYVNFFSFWFEGNYFMVGAEGFEPPAFSV